METVYVDESQIGGTGNGGAYVMVATIVLDGDPDDHRRHLERVKPKGMRKLHWYSCKPGVKERVVRVVGDLPLMHWAVVMGPAEDETPERTRRKCIERLFWELSGLEMVGQVCMESRGPADDKRDMQMVGSLKTSKIIPGSMRVDHLRGIDDPLLWLPDAVCGVVGSAVSGDDRWSKDLDHQLWIVP